MKIYKKNINNIEYINIDNIIYYDDNHQFIKNINNNPSIFDIFDKLNITNIVKYNKTFNFIIDNLNDINIIYDNDKDIYYYIFYIIRDYVDIISNIKSNNNIKLFIDEKIIIDCNINNLTIPIFYIIKNSCSFIMELNNNLPYNINISYDIYVLNNNIRKELINSNNYIINNENIIFHNNSFYNKL